MEGFVIIPKSELEKLELARVALYEKIAGDDIKAAIKLQPI